LSTDIVSNAGLTLSIQYVYELLFIFTKLVSLLSGCKYKTLFPFPQCFLMFFEKSFFYPFPLNIQTFCRTAPQKQMPFLAAANIRPFSIYIQTFYALFLRFFLRGFKGIIIKWLHGELLLFIPHPYNYISNFLIISGLH